MNVTLRRAFVRALAIQGVPENQRRWCVRWVERFERFLPGLPLSGRSHEDLERFIASLREAGASPTGRSSRPSSLSGCYITAFSGKSGPEA